MAALRSSQPTEVAHAGRKYRATVSDPKGRVAFVYGETPEEAADVAHLVVAARDMRTALVNLLDTYASGMPHGMDDVEREAWDMARAAARLAVGLE